MIKLKFQIKFNIVLSTMDEEYIFIDRNYLILQEMFTKLKSAIQKIKIKS